MLTTRKPYNRLATFGLFPELDGVFNGLLPATDPVMPVDFSDEGDHYSLRTDVPGVAKENIDISVERGVLTLACQRKAETEKGRRLLSERRSGKITRSFTLPEDVDSDAISATLENGVLTLSLGKVSRAKPKQIEVKVT